MSAKQIKTQTYTIDDVIQIPIELRDQDGVAHVRAIFKRRREPGPESIGPRGLDPDHVLELRGNGNNEQHTVVKVELQVADRHEPGDYICVAIQVYDANGNMEMINNPIPTRVFRIVGDEKNDDTQQTEFLGWADVDD